MTRLPALTPHEWLTGWSVAPVPLLVSAALAVLYLVLAGRRPDWPRSRTLWFLLAGVGSLLAVTQSFLGTYDRASFWPLAVQDVLLLTLVPLGLTLGHPLELLRVRLPAFLRFPLVGSVVAVGTLLAIYTSGWDEARLGSAPLFAATQVLLLVLGCAFLWPLLGVDQGTGSTSYPVRALIAFIDGLLDAVPGLAILGTGHVIAAAHYRTTSRHDQVIGGTAMVALSELVGLPALVLLLVQWVRSDAGEASVIDDSLDHEPVTDAPWWEVDPGPLGDRFQR